MGNFYVSLTLKGPSQEQVCQAMTEMRRTACIACPVPGITVVYDEECDSQDTEVVCKLSEDLSRQFHCTVWAVLNHDDDILWYVLYQDGAGIDEYNSSPGCFEPGSQPTPPSGGDGKVLARAFGKEMSAGKIEDALRKHTDDADAFVFAIERHHVLAQELGIPFEYVATGYGYVSSDDAPGVDPEKVQTTGTQPGV